MAAAEHYDALVIGDELSSSLCLALLARRKLRARVLPMAKPDARPPAPPLFGLRTATLGPKVLDELGLVHAMRQLELPPEALTIALPDRRFRLESTTAARGLALGAAFPHDHTALLELFSRIEAHGRSLEPLLDGSLEVEPEGLVGRRAYKRRVERLPSQILLKHAKPWSERHVLRQMIDAMLMMAGRPERGEGAMSAGGARALWHLCHGISAVRGGMPALRSTFEDKAHTHGAAPSGTQKIVSLEVGRRRIEAAHTRRGDRLSADTFIFCGTDAELARLTGAPAPDDDAAQILSAVRVDCPAAAHPPRLQDPTAWVYAADLRPIRVRRDAEGLDLVWREGGTPPTIAELMPHTAHTTGAPRSFADPVGQDVDPFGLFTRPCRTAQRNLFRAGEWVLPGLGFETACASAWHAVAHVERLCPKRRRVPR